LTGLSLDPVAPGEAADLAALVVALYAEDDHGPVPMTPARARAQVLAMLATPDRVRPLWIRLDDEVAGYVILAEFWSNEFGGPMLYVDEMYVRPALRGRGIGSAILDRLVAEARARDLVRVSLEVNEGNPRAEALYRRLGFTSEARRTLSVQLRPVPGASATGAPRPPRRRARGARRASTLRPPRRTSSQSRRRRPTG